MRTLNARRLVCGLLFLSTALSYYDRQIIGLLKPSLQGALHWSERDYGVIVMSFQLAYAVGLLLAGRAVDRCGAALALAVCVTLWSAASAVLLPRLVRRSLRSRTKEYPSVRL